MHCMGLLTAHHQGLQYYSITVLQYYSITGLKG